MSTGYENLPEREVEGGPEITRTGHKYVLDTSNNQENVPFLARIVFQQWLSNSQGVDPKVIPIQYSINGKVYIREDVYRPEAEADWYRQKKERGEA